jgi:hypothetical protein
VTPARRIPEAGSPFPPPPVLTPKGEERLAVGDGPKSRSPELPESRSPGDPESGTPRYQEFERTEARLRDDQVVELAALRKRVAAQRARKTERITDNTLLRIAVDLLLAYGDFLAGDTEDDLRRSLLAPPDGAALPRYQE